MNRKEMLLICLAEECSELIKVATKSLRFGLDSDNRGKREETNTQLLQEEFSDIVGIMRLLMDEGYIPLITADEMEANAQRKKERFDKYYTHSQELGILKENV